MIYAGHLKDEVLIAAFGMANMMCNCFFYSPICGVNSAMETLGSQAAGADNKKLVGVYHNRGRIVLLLLWVVLWLCSF